MTQSLIIDPRKTLRKPAQKTLQKRGKNGKKTLPEDPFSPFSDKRYCLCGCGEEIKGRSTKKFFNDAHRQDYFIENKKDATFEAIWRVIYIFSGFNVDMADRVAFAALDTKFEAWCRCLARCDFSYNTQTCAWEFPQYLKDHLFFLKA